jgi:hypothetical protein
MATATPSNKGVLLGGTVIITVGFVKAVTTPGGNPYRVVAGGLGVVLVASLLELFGDQASRLATAFVGLATITVLLVEMPAIATAISNAQAKKPATPAPAGLINVPAHH